MASNADIAGIVLLVALAFLLLIGAFVMVFHYWYVSVILIVGAFYLFFKVIRPNSGL